MHVKGLVRALAPALAIALLLGVSGHIGRHGAIAVHADSASLWFDPSATQPGDVLVVSFEGFADGEVIDLSFADPSGQAATVGSGSVFYASTQDDGTGAFHFRPSDWLNTVPGNWAVTAVGEQSGLSVTTTFTILSNG